MKILTLGGDVTAGYEEIFYQTMVRISPYLILIHGLGIQVLTCWP